MRSASASTRLSEVDKELYHIWTKKLPVSELGDVKLVIAEKETDDDDEENPIQVFRHG